MNNNFMKFMNNMKRFSIGIIVLWTAMGSCLAQSISTQPPAPPGASDQQIQGKDLADKRGKEQVDDFTGSFGYSIPIACAPARNGSEPKLALAYSSKGDNGWCGMGWKLDIGYIERNTQNGFPIQFTTANPPAPSTAYNDTNGFILNLFGKELKLLPTATANEYRPEVDTDFLRCILDTTGNKWTVYDKSGNAYYFGQTASSRVVNPKTSAGWGGYSGTFHWALDQIDTPTGDRTTVTYQTYTANYNSTYSGQPEGTIYPLKITYNSHASINGNGYGASYTGTHTISFTTVPRDQVGQTDWHFSYRWGFRTEQTRLLTSILCQVGPVGSQQNVCRYALSYVTSPATGRSLLNTVTTYGSDNSTALPVQTFTYQANPNRVSFGAPVRWNGITPPQPGTETWVSQVNGYEPGAWTIADLVDIDGDGLPDWVVYEDTGVTTRANQYLVYKNLGTQSGGNGAFSTTAYAFGPTSSGGGATASASHPIPDGDATWAAMNSQHVRLRDINGDGLPDRVCDYWYFYSFSPPLNPAYYTNFEVMLNNGNGFASTVGWTNINPGPGSSVAGNDATLYDCVESGGVNAGLFDINGDGLPDRVLSMYYQEGAMTNFRVQFNTGTNFSSIKLFGPYHSQNYNNGPGGQGQPFLWAGIETPNVHMTDINGDGLPDRVMLPINPSTPPNAVLPQNRNQLMVEYNDGYSFEAVNTDYTHVGQACDAWPIVNPSYPPFSGNDYYEVNNPPFVGLYDLNGDGLPDRVVLDESTANNNSTSKQWLVYLNNGHGFNTTPITVTGIYDQSSQSGSSKYNDAGWWGTESSYYGSTAVTLMDINGDGLLDRVMTVYGNNGPNNSYFLVQTNTGPFPDLLTNINNGIGGIIGVSYAPSTVWDNRKDTVANSGSTLPFVQYTVAAVTESDGINIARTTSYSYAGGFFDGSRREFAGFAVVTNTDATSRKTITYFHTGGGRNYSALGEYNDAGNFAKRGMPYRIETYGNESTPLLYKVVVNQVDQMSFNNGTRFFPFVSQSFDYDYPGGGTPRITGSKFVYTHITSDNNIYNLTTKILWGEVLGVSLTSITTPSNNTADDQYYQYIYASISYSPPSGGTFYISDHPLSVSLTDFNNNVIQQTAYTYNSPSGTIATKQRLICSGQYATTTYNNNYNAYGLPTLIADPVGVQTAITYDGTYYMYPATTTVGNSMVTTTTYDVRSGLLTAKTDPMNINMQNLYDVFFRLTETDKGITPGGAANALWVKRITYPPTLGVITAGNAVNYVDVQLNDGVGGVESRTYVDGFSRPIQTRTQGENGNYRVTSTAYDARGEAFLTTWPRFESSIYFSKPNTLFNPQPASFIGYDAAGRVNLTYRRVQATFNNNNNGEFDSESYSGPALGDSGSLLAANQLSYVNGTDPWWKIETDEDGRVRQYQLDAFGRNTVIREVYDSTVDYYTTTLKYDLAGNLTNIVNQNGENIYYAYDAVGNKVAMADPYLGQWTYQRDSAGRLRVQTDARGDVVTNSYIDPATGQQDPLGRVHIKAVFKSVADFNAGNPVSVATYTYDANTIDNSTYPLYKGLLYMVTDSEGWEKNGYDTRGRLIITTRHLNVNNQNYTTSYTYDNGDHVLSITYPNSGLTIIYTYFHGGSINQVSRSGYTYYTVNAGNYDEFEHVTQFQYGNGVTTTRYYYPNSKRLDYISTSPSVFGRTYTYTFGDDIASILGTGITGTMSVAYDYLHRIHSYSGLGNGNIYYGYEAVGSITANIETGTAVTYNYGNARKQQVKSAFNMNYYYDLCGNMIVRHGGTTGSQAMAYDPENRLTVFSQAGTIVMEYGYAADGTRLWKRVDQDPAQVQLWIGKIYEEKNDTAVPPVKHTLFHVFAGDQQVCMFEAGSALAVSGGNTSLIGYYYHEDNLNSSSALSSSTAPASQQEMNVYYPFGRVQATTSQPGTFQVSRQFTGQIKDDETGLYYYNARYYDPELGRFIQPDTDIPDLSNPQSYNRYSYVLNNPLRYTDPTGHYEDLGEIKILANGYVAPGNGELIQFAGQQRLQTLNWAECAAINMHIAAERGDAFRAEIYAKQIQGMDYNWLIASGEHPAETSQNLLGIGVGLMGSVHTPEAGGAEVGTPKITSETSPATKSAGAVADDVSLTTAQQAKLNAFNKNLPKANTGTSVDTVGDQVLFTAEVPGKVPGSKAVYQKTVDSAGTTTSMVKTTVDPKGSVVHIKDKLPPPPQTSN